MIPLVVSIGSLLVGASLLMLGNGLLGILLPMWMEHSAYSKAVTGTVMSCYFGGLVLGSIYAQSVILRVGHIRAFAGFAAVAAAASLLHALLFTAYFWGLLRLVNGFCIAGLFAVMESWLNARADNATRGRVLASYVFCTYVAMAAGMLLINIWTMDSVRPFMLAALLVTVSLVPIVLTRIEAPALANPGPLPLRDLYAASPLAVVGSLAAGLLLGAHYGMGAVFAKDVGFDLFQISLFSGSVIVGGILLQWPIGLISDRYDRRLVLVGLLVLTAGISGMGTFLVVTGPESCFGLVSIGVFMGGAIAAIYPISMAQAYDHLDPDHYVAAGSGLLLAFASGATLGPLLVSIAMGLFGPQGYFLFMAIGSLVLGGFAAHRLRARGPVPQSQAESFVVVPRLSPVVAELDPRTESAAEDREMAGTPP